MTTYVTVAIPYVNAAPHLGYSYELVEADIYARALRRAGESVRFLGGTDDHSLKNVLAAEAAGRPTAEFVAANARRFEHLAEPLGLSFDDFIHTSTDPRHRPAVERLWRACAANSDLYRKAYEGQYCTGCEQFYEPGDAVDGRCPEHGTSLEQVAEENWFFRLVGVRGPPRAIDRRRRPGGPTRAVPPGGARIRTTRPARHQRVPLGAAGSRMGHWRPGRSDAGDLCLVRRADQLPQRARLR